MAPAFLLLMCVSLVGSATLPQQVDMCAQSQMSNLTAVGDSALVATSSTLAGSNCTIRVPGVLGASLAVEWKSFLLSPDNYVTVLQDDGAVLLAAATGTTAPPPVASAASRGVTIIYDARVSDPHDSGAGDGVVALVTAQAPAGSGDAVVACAAATSCGECLDVTGCAWCADNSSSMGAASGSACQWTGVSAMLDLDGSVTFSTVAAPAAACAVNSSVTAAAVCATLTDAASNILRSSGGDLTASAPFGLGAAFSQLYVTGDGSRLYPLLAVIVGFHLVSLLLLVMVISKVRFSSRTGVRVSVVTELAGFFLCICRLLELWAQLILENIALTHVSGLSAFINAPISLVQVLITVATAASTAQFSLLAILAYMAHVIPLNAKHGFCALTLLFGPLVILESFVSVISYTERGRLIALMQLGPDSFGNSLKALQGVPSFFPPVLADTCELPDSQLTLSGARMPAVNPQFVPLFYLIGAGTQALAAVVSSSATCSTLRASNAEMATVRSALTWNAVGVAVTMFSLPVEAAAVWTALCAPVPQKLFDLKFFALTIVPAAMQIAGLSIVFVSALAQLRSETKGTVAPAPAAADAAFKTPVKEKQKESASDQNAHLRVRSP